MYNIGCLALERESSHPHVTLENSWSFGPGSALAVFGTDARLIIRR